MLFPYFPNVDGLFFLLSQIGRQVVPRKHRYGRDSTINAIGQITNSTLGNGLARGATYNSYDILTSLTLKKGSEVRDNMSFVFKS